jgi:membrane fusion protein (multidrug efflux system)
MDAVTREAPEVEGEAVAWRRRVLVWVLPLLVVAGAVYFYGSAGRYVSTDNAYLQQDRVDVAPQVSGNVARVFVSENSHVEAGAPLLQLDDALLRIALSEAQSRLTAARADVAGLKAAYREKQGEISVAQRAAELTTRDFKRQQELADRKLIAAATLDSANRSATVASGAVGVLELQLEQTAARLGGNPNLAIDTYPTVRTALSELERAEVDLGYALIRAPQSGIVSHLPKVGARVEIGRAACAIVTDQSLWVEANFKETDLEWVRPGEPVRVDVDTYGEHRWHGRVESIAQATGAEFSLLPAQNATGNWVKVVQRIPVRIALDRRPDDPPLRDGMSATVEIDTGPHTRFDRWFGHRG